MIYRVIPPNATADGPTSLRVYHFPDVRYGEDTGWHEGYIYPLSRQTGNPYYSRPGTNATTHIVSCIINSEGSVAHFREI